MQIICLGDSITDCKHLFEDFPLGNGYVQILSEMFRNQTPSFSISADTVRRSSSAVQLTDKSTGAIHFRNCGIDGFTVTRVLENIRQHRIFLHRSPVITLLIGINDIGLIMNTDRTDSQKEQMMREFATHYNELLNLLTADARQVILMEPFIFPHPEEYETWIPYVHTMSDIIRQLSVRFRLPFLPLHNYFNKEATQSGFDAITTDGIHLTLYGHKLLAEKLFPLLQNIDNNP